LTGINIPVVIHHFLSAISHEYCKCFGGAKSTVTAKSIYAPSHLCYDIGNFPKLLAKDYFSRFYHIKNRFLEVAYNITVQII
jgi:hypothetical protein